MSDTALTFTANITEEWGRQNSAWHPRGNVFKKGHHVKGACQKEEIKSNVKGSSKSAIFFSMPSFTLAEIQGLAPGRKSG